MDKLLRDGRTLYNLHTKVYKQNGYGFTPQPVECNKFWLAVQPDYGGGITELDALRYAEEIQNAVNSYDELTQQNEALRKDIEGMSKENEKVKKEYKELIEQWAHTLARNVQLKEEGRENKAIIRKLEDETERLRLALKTAHDTILTAMYNHTIKEIDVNFKNVCGHIADEIEATLKANNINQ